MIEAKSLSVCQARMSDKSLRARLQSVMRVTDQQDLLRELVDFTQWLGFKTVAATAVLDGGDVRPQFVTVDNTPASYVDSFNCLEAARRDPVMQHCRWSHLPISWNQATYVAVGQGEKWDHQAAHGYRVGIAWAMHPPYGRHLCVGVDRDQALPTRQDRVVRLMGDLQLFVVYALEGALRVLTPPSSEAPCQAPLLTRREVEALSWTMEGKTAWEVGGILGISEQTAVRHLNNATHKLKCVSKHQAVVKALRLGLIR
jgi:DNA-binding CsgD family transcriptional regulator